MGRQPRIKGPGRGHRKGETARGRGGGPRTGGGGPRRRARITRGWGGPNRTPPATREKGRLGRGGGATWPAAAPGGAVRARPGTGGAAVTPRRVAMASPLVRDIPADIHRRLAAGVVAYAHSVVLPHRVIRERGKQGPSQLLERYPLRDSGSRK